MKKRGYVLFFLGLLIVVSLVTPASMKVSGYGQEETEKLPVTVVEYAKSRGWTSSAEPKHKKHNRRIAPQAASPLIWDNGNFNNVTGLASEINTFVSEARTADDVMFPITTTVNCITAQLYDNTGLFTARVEIWADDGTGTLPSNTGPIATYPSTGGVVVGTGFGFPIVEYTFDTTGLVLTGGVKYWISPQVVGAGSGRGFFATSSALNLNRGAFRSVFFGRPNWVPAGSVVVLANSDFAFKLYGGSLTSDHTTVYAVDTGNHRVQRSTDDGVTWAFVGTQPVIGPGTALGRFNSPRDVEASGDDQIIFVADAGNHRIQRSTDGGLTWSVVNTFAGPSSQVGGVNGAQGLAYDEVNDILYVADTGNHRIQRVNGASTSTPIWSLVAGGTIGTALGRFNKPSGIAVDLEGNIYVADTGNNRVQFGLAGTTFVWSIFAGLTQGSALGKVIAPRDIHINANGDAYVADTGNNRIQFAPSTLVWELFNTALQPQGVTYNANGFVFYSDTSTNRVMRRPADRSTAAVPVGPQGNTLGRFYTPTGIR